MKIPGKIFITELPFTHELRRLGMVDVPVWVDFDSDMNVYLMNEMGGMDLPSQTDLDTLTKVIVQLAHTQKDSIPYLPLSCKCNDYRVNTILEELNDFSIRSFDILSSTQYKITCGEKKKLERRNYYFQSVLRKFIKKDFR